MLVDGWGEREPVTGAETEKKRLVFRELKNTTAGEMLCALRARAQVGVRLPLPLSLSMLRRVPNMALPVTVRWAHVGEGSAAPPEQPRTNPLGIQYLSESLQQQVFPGATGHSEDPELVKLAKLSLSNHDLLGRKTTITKPIAFKLPELQGSSLDEHFQRLGLYASEPYRTMALEKFKSIPEKPKNWIRKPGWYRYEKGKEPTRVDFPSEDTLVFDVETLYKISPYPTLATAVSDKAWYLWCSPYICDPKDSDKHEVYEHLIPMDTLNKEKLIIGHNVGYDRGRVLEEYNLKPSKAFFIDTLSLHVATAGLCSRQRPLFLKNKKLKENLTAEPEEIEEVTEALELNDVADPWLKVSTMNALSDVALFHCGIKMDKTTRDYFASTNKQDVIDKFQLLVNYCATDVITTSKVFDKVFPSFMKKCPHPVSFGGLKALSSCILPTDQIKWQNYITNSENKYQDSKKVIDDKIIEIVQETVKLKDQKGFQDVIKTNPWLRQLDWVIKPLRLTKKGVPVKNQKLPGYPEWYRSLFPNKEAELPQITMRSRIIPLFFKLSWEDSPVIWTEDCGWCFTKPKSQEKQYKDKNYRLADEATIKNHFEKLVEMGQYKKTDIGNDLLFKVPHPNGPDNNCTTLLSKPYVHFFEKGILKSESELASIALKMNASGSYWMSARERIMSQFVVPKEDFPEQFLPIKVGKDLKPTESSQAIIIPQIIPMGTVTRRAVESTWLTASNAKKNRIGSELKAQICAPEGYSFVGADVDSEELWIASLFGDSVLRIHGGTPIGWMCLEGTKAEGSDLHTKTAQILSCDRNEAKIFNYGRIYGAGVKFASQLLKKFNPTLSEKEAKETAVKLYESTKGKTKRSKVFKKFWYGGSESILFNKLESIAEQDNPMTPVLGCGITNSLMKQNLKANSFLPSRVNWAIQSSGVDYLHLLCCSMNYLISMYNIEARLIISIHDEIRYLVADKDKYKLALALQISNLWTRAMFAEQMGIRELPQNCAFFSAIDIDKVLRKEVDLDCVTPSNEIPIPFGESIDIVKLLERPECHLELPRETVDLSKFGFKKREPVFVKYNNNYSADFLKYFLKMQIQTTSWKVSKLEEEYIQNQTEKDMTNEDRLEYGFLDYLSDVKKGKRDKLTIMSKAFISDALSSRGLDLDAQLNLDPSKTETIHNITSDDKSRLQAQEDFSLLHDSVSTLEHMDTKSPTREKATTISTALLEINTNSKKGRRRTGRLLERKYNKVIGGKNAFDAFYASIDQPKKFVELQEQRIINEVIHDIIEGREDTPTKKPRQSKPKSTTPVPRAKQRTHPFTENLVKGSTHLTK